MPNEIPMSVLSPSALQPAEKVSACVEPRSANICIMISGKF